MALTEQQIRQITDEIVRSLSGSIRAEAAAPAPARSGLSALRQVFHTLSTEFSTA